MFCPNCGQQIAAKAAFCGYCGQPLAVAETSQVGKKRGAVALAIYLLIVIAIVFGGWLLFQPDFLQSFANREADTAVSVIQTPTAPTEIGAVNNTPLPSQTEMMVPSPTPSVTSTATPSPSPTIPPEPTDTPEPTPTPAPPTPSPTVDLSPVSLSGNDLVQLTFGDGLHYTPSLSPDQQQMVISVRTGAYWQLFAVDPHGQGVTRQITDEPANFYHPQFAADGRQILVASDRDGGHMDIYLLDFATGEVLQQLTNTPGDNYAPWWLPDYTGFVFTSTRDGHDEVYRFDLDTMTATRLTNSNSFDGFATVSPDGRQIVFYSNRDRDYEIYRMGIDGQNPQRLTFSPGRDAMPVFSPNGQWILFESERSSRYEIYRMRLDGSDVQNLTNHPSDNWIPTFSPDGLWLLFQSNRAGDMHVFRQPWDEQALAQAESVVTPTATPCARAVANLFNLDQNAITQLGCPTTGSFNITAVTENFQRGRMFWRGDNRSIYVLYNSGRWSSHSDTWREGQPTFTCGVNSSPPTPLRGFGKVWCENSQVREGLGNATNQEYAITATLQGFANGLVMRAEGRTYVLFYSGEWR
jgi:Tol biopolymer transport system component